MIKGGFKGGFSIKKKEAKVQNVTKRGFEKIEEDKNNAEIIHTVDEGGIVGTNIKVEDKPLIIPCIKVNKWNDIKNGNGKRSQVDRGEVRANKKQFEKDTNDEAINQIINDANRFLDQQENKSDAKTLNIPLLMQNRIPEGEELEEGPLKVEIRPESSNLDDYDAVPIESFGLGMLRGMGWNEAEGIGKTRQNISEFITNVRPKGLGLGAIPVKKKLENNAKANNQAPLTMRPGAFVRLIDGPYKERYGKVLSLDGDLGRVTIKWALGKYGAPSEVNEIFTEVVSQKEYDDNGKDISRTTKVALEEKQKIIDLDQQQSISNMVSNLKKKPTKSKKEYGKSRKPAETKWVHIGLIVQYVGDRKSKHYMQKFEVRKVKSRSAIACRYLEKEKEYDFHERDLQTVVPKNEGQIIMVLKGSLSGTFGRVIERQKEKDRVMVELFNENKDVERIDFDNVCQFNGTISDFT